MRKGPALRLDRTGNLDEAHQWNRIEKVRSGYALGMWRAGSDIADGKGRGIREDDGIRSAVIAMPVLMVPAPATPTRMRFTDSSRSNYCSVSEEDNCVMQ